MSKKIYIGLFIGLLAGFSVPALLRFRRDEELFSEEDLSEENDLLDKANHYLLLARNKVEDMVKEAEEKSNSILEQAAMMMKEVKEKTANLHTSISKGASDEAERIKDEINKRIEDLKKSIEQ